MPYKNLRGAFLFQAAVGIVSFVSVLTMGRTGLALIAFLAFRPFAFRRLAGSPGDPVKRIYSRSFRSSLVTTAAFLVAGYLARESGMLGDIEGYLLLLLLVPAYMVIHGITGFILAGSPGADDGPSGGSARDQGRPL